MLRPLLPMMPSSRQNRDRKGAEPHVYLITFACYGTHLPGQIGAVDRNHNLYGGLFPEPDDRMEAHARSLMHHQCYLLEIVPREIVLGAIIEACVRRRWLLLAAHVRTTHVHAIVSADHTPEHVMNTLKSNASRALNRSGLEPPDCRRWARHGSTRYLWTHEQVSSTIRHVISEQGTRLAVYEAPFVVPAPAP